MLLVSTACDDGGGQPETPVIPTAASPTTPALTCGVAAPDGSMVEVAEAGFSMVSEPGDDPVVSYGAVLENASAAYLAIQTLVVVHLADAEGNEAIDVIGEPPRAPSQAVHTIFPGQRMGIGAEAYVDRGELEEITVEVGASLWMPIAQARDVGEATATDIDFERTGTDGARIGFNVAPTVDPSQGVTSSESISDAQSWAIFRDPEGTIGGGSGLPGTSWSGLTDNEPITGTVQVSSVPDGLVESSTEIYVSPFYPPYDLRPC